jgi:hypothetical protein
MCCGLLRTGFRSSERRQYSGSLSQEFDSNSANNYLEIPEYRVAGSSQLAIYITAITYTLTHSSSSFHDPTAPSGPGPPRYRGFTITLRHTTLGRTPLHE